MGRAELAYDARYLTAEPTGIGRLCGEILQGFAQLTDGPRLQVLIAPETVVPPTLTHASHLEWCLVPWQPYSLRDQFSLAPWLRQRGVRLLHSVDAFHPLWHQGLRGVITIHDTIPFSCAHLPTQSKKTRFRLLWKAWLQWQCARAQAVVTVSQHSAHDIARLLHVPVQKIHVIYNPVRAWGAIEPPAAFRQRLGLTGTVLAYVGRRDPYKNVLGLVRAMALLKHMYPEPVQLVIAGPHDPRYPEAYTEVRRLQLTDTVVFPGYLDDASLGALYHVSDVFVFPSLYEGFGLPPLEAMSCGTPVVASNRTALPEILGDAALLVDPEDPQALAAGILRVLTDPTLAQQLRRAGYARAALFSASQAAAQYAALYERLLALP